MTNTSRLVLATILEAMRVPRLMIMRARAMKGKRRVKLKVKLKASLG